MTALCRWLFRTYYFSRFVSLAMVEFGIPPMPVIWPSRKWVEFTWIKRQKSIESFMLCSVLYMHCITKMKFMYKVSLLCTIAYCNITVDHTNRFSGSLGNYTTCINLYINALMLNFKQCPILMRHALHHLSLYIHLMRNLWYIPMVNGFMSFMNRYCCSHGEVYIEEVKYDSCLSVRCLKYGWLTLVPNSDLRWHWLFCSAVCRNTTYTTT